MKTVELPSKERSQLLDGYRTEDFLMGLLSELYFNVSYAGYYVCKKTFRICRRDNISFLLMLTVSGEGELSYQGKQYHLIPNSVMLIDTRIFHEYYALTEGWSFKFIHFQGGMSEKYHAYIDNRLGPFFSVTRELGYEIEKYLDSILKETEKKADIDYPVVSSQIYSILALLLSQKNAAVNADQPKLPLQLALEYLINHYHEKITTHDIASAAHLSRSYLYDLFTKTYGIGPHEYLTMFRLSQAKRLLINTEKSITEIAEETGFRDVYMFSRVFKNKVGMTPSAFRKLR